METYARICEANATRTPGWINRIPIQLISSSSEQLIPHVSEFRILCSCWLTSRRLTNSQRGPLPFFFRFCFRCQDATVNQIRTLLFSLLFPFPFPPSGSISSAPPPTVHFTYCRDHNSLSSDFIFSLLPIAVIIIHLRLHFSPTFLVLAATKRHYECLRPSSSVLSAHFLFCPVLSCSFLSVSRFRPTYKSSCFVGKIWERTGLRFSLSWTLLLSFYHYVFIILFFPNSCWSPLEIGSPPRDLIQMDKWIDWWTEISLFLCSNGLI